MYVTLTELIELLALIVLIVEVIMSFHDHGNKKN